MRSCRSKYGINFGTYKIVCKILYFERTTLPLSRTNKEKLEPLKQNYQNFSVEYISVDPDNFRGMAPPISEYITVDSYFRYLIPEAVLNLKKAIHLDVDIIVQSNIAELYNFSLDNCYIGGVNHPKEY